MQRTAQSIAPRRFGVGVGFVAFALVILLAALGRLESTENALLRMRFDLRGPRSAAPEVVLLAIEEASVRGESDVHTSVMPWSRAQLAEVINQLDRAGAAVIGLDLPALAGNDIHAPTSADDLLLADAMRRHGGVVLPMIVRETMLPGDEQAASVVERFVIGRGTLEKPIHLRPGGLAVPSPALIEAAAGVGATNIYLDLDGAAREAPLAISVREKIYPAFWVELVRVFEGVAPEAVRVEPGRIVVGGNVVETDDDLEVMINYVGGYLDFPRRSSDSVFDLSSEELARHVGGKIVVIGADLAGGTTLLSTPTAPSMPGVEVAATVTENLVSENSLVRPPGWLTPLLTLLLALTVGALTAQSRALNALMATLTFLVFIIVVGFVLFRVGILVRLAAPLVAVAITGGVLAAHSASTSERRRAEAEAALQSRLQAIAGIGRLVNSSLDREQLLLEILRWAESEVDAEASSVMTVAPDGQHLAFEVALGEKAEMLKDITVQLGEGIAGTAAATGEAIVAQDVAADERWRSDVAYAIDYDTRSILCVPMLLRDEVIGVIELINKRGGVFTDYDVQLMQVIAHQSAMFLENARLYRELSDRVDFANEELRRTNDRLRFEMARIATLVDEMADAVIATDGSDRVVIFNNEAERMFGIPAERAQGKLAVTLLDDHPEVSDLFAMPLSPHGGAYETEITLDEGAGVVLRAHIALVDEPGARSVGKCAVFTNISHLKQLDRMKMDLISFVSHELKNPIASLQGSCNLLESRLDIQDERTARLLEIAGRQARRMQYLVQDFLDLSRIEAGQELSLNLTEIDDPQELIEGALALCRRLSPERPVSVNVAPDTPTIRADRNKLEAVVINLVENAAKYSAPDSPIAVNVYPSDSEVILAVEDRGSGIREEDLPRLFRSFQRVHDDSYGQVSGTGVGLYICRHIMQAHGGEITVESTWGEGSTFSLHLPRHDAKRKEATDA